MAFPNDRNQFQNKGGQGNTKQRDKTPKPKGGQGNTKQRDKTPKPIEAKPVPDDYVMQAETVMRELRKPDPARKWKPVTTTKIRNLFSLVVDICSEEERCSESALRSESVAGLKRMYVRAVYEFGRDEATKEFIEKAKLLEYIKWIENDRERLIRFTRYMEALIAFHRYLGGKEA